MAEKRSTGRRFCVPDNGAGAIQAKSNPIIDIPPSSSQQASGSGSSIGGLSDQIFAQERCVPTLTGAVLTLRILLFQLTLIGLLVALDTWLSGGPGILAPSLGLFCGASLGLRGAPIDRPGLPRMALPVASAMGAFGAALYSGTQPLPAWWAPLAVGALAALSTLVLTLAAGDTLLNHRSKGVAKHKGRWGEVRSYYGDLE